MSRGRWAMVLPVLLVLGAVAAAYAAGQAKTPAAEVIRAQRFELVDAEGRMWGEMSMGARGRSPGLRFCDENGEVRAEMVLVKGEPALTFYNEKRRARAELAVVRRKAVLGLCDEEGKQRAALVVMPDTRVMPEPGVMLVLCDPKRDGRATLMVAYDGSPNLVLSDEEGEAIFSPWPRAAGG